MLALARRRLRDHGVARVALARADAIRGELRAELAGGPRTGMRPVDGDDGLDYTQTWEIAVGRVTTP